MKFYRTALKSQDIGEALPVLRPHCDKKFYCYHCFPDAAVVSCEEVPATADVVDIDTLPDTEAKYAKKHLKLVVKTHLDWWRDHPDAAPKKEEQNP